MPLAGDKRPAAVATRPMWWSSLHHARVTTLTRISPELLTEIPHL
jgi:hypothetical protein